MSTRKEGSISVLVIGLAFLVVLAIGLRSYVQDTRSNTKGDCTVQEVRGVVLTGDGSALLVDDKGQTIGSVGPTHVSGEGDR